jgi:hypothetical protein
VYSYKPLLDRLVASIPALFQHQVDNPSRWDHGAFIVGQPYGCAVADHTTHGEALARCCYALLLPDSTLRGDAELRARTIDALGFQRRAQRATGLIDLPKVDFDSPPDTAFMVQLLCPVTSISLRQDGGKACVPVTMADSYFALGMTESRGDWLDIADRLVAAAERHRQLDPGALCWLLQPFAEHPEWIDAPAARTPPADRIDVFHPASRFWRVGHGDMAATVCAGNPNAFALSCGDVRLAALSIKGSFFNLADFCADRIERTATGVRLDHLASAREAPGWDLPLGRRVAFDNPHQGYYQLAGDGTRERWGITPIDIRLEVEAVDGGFDLHLVTEGGYDRIPFVVDCHLNAGTTLDTNRLMLRPQAGDELLLGGGRAIAHSQDYAISIAGGGMAHRMIELMGRPKLAGCYRLFMAFLSPLDEVIEIRYGRWSEATRDLVPLGIPSAAQATPA